MLTAVTTSAERICFTFCTINDGKQNHRFAASLTSVNVRRAMLARWEQDDDVKSVLAKHGWH